MSRSFPRLVWLAALVSLCALATARPAAAQYCAPGGAGQSPLVILEMSPPEVTCVPGADGGGTTTRHVANKFCLFKKDQHKASGASGSTASGSAGTTVYMPLNLAPAGAPASSAFGDFTALRAAAYEAEVRRAQIEAVRRQQDEELRLYQTTFERLSKGFGAPSGGLPGEAYFKSLEERLNRMEQLLLKHERFIQESVEKQQKEQAKEKAGN